jgi:AmmeMemoRadiSam system protein B
MNFSDAFYPSACEKTNEYFKTFNSFTKELRPKFQPKAIIAPHAGYIYSGYTANCAYKLLDKKAYKRVVVIGPSHREYLKGASVSLYDTYETPCGEISIDLVYAKKLMNKYTFLSFEKRLHKEHSTETQMPFIKHYFPHAKVLEIVYSDITREEMKPMFEEILAEKETLLVVSSDLSHFYTLKKANEVDKICINAIEKLELKAFEKGCEACGLLGIRTLVSVAKESQIVDYRTSYDANGDDVRVVGYLSALLR